MGFSAGFPFSMAARIIRATLMLSGISILDKYQMHLIDSAPWPP
jgi:hypothetical protein